MDYEKERNVSIDNEWESCFTWGTISGIKPSISQSCTVYQKESPTSRVHSDAVTYDPRLAHTPGGVTWHPLALTDPGWIGAISWGWQRIACLPRVAHHPSLGKVPFHVCGNWRPAWNRLQLPCTIHRADGKGGKKFTQYHLKPIDSISISVLDKLLLHILFNINRFLKMFWLCLALLVGYCTLDLLWRKPYRQSQ